jgi:LuxR family maltose regulon positive regulatory protein
LNLAGERDQAVRELASSLKTASGISLIQPLLDEREILGSLLPQAAAEANVILPGLAGQEDASVPRPVYVEPLTPREQNVLEHMTTHLTYLEIASEMYVSTNTVKSHQKAIFRKLAVSKRSDAVARARAYGLVS